MSRSIRRALLLVGAALLPCVTLLPGGLTAQSSPVACDWIVRASSPIGMSDRGTNATYMDMGPATMFTLTGDQGSGASMITIQGLNGPGLYPIGNPESGGFAVITITDQNQTPIALSTGDGSPVRHNGAIIGYLPPPAQVAIQAIDPNNEIRADVTGTLVRMDGMAQSPPQLVLVPIHITFTAAPLVPSMGARPCR